MPNTAKTSSASAWVSVAERGDIGKLSGRSLQSIMYIVERPRQVIDFRASDGGSVRQVGFMD